MPETVDDRIAHRLASLRSERSRTLNTLARKTGISRATLSRLEHGDISPSASMLNKLCAHYGCTASRLMADAEAAPPTLIRAAEQVIWKDPETHYIRRVVSPPHPNLLGELVEVSLPAGALVSYDVSPLPGLEHHLWMLEGEMALDLGDAHFYLKKGDCLRYVLSGPSRFTCGEHPARYIIAMVRPK